MNIDKYIGLQYGKPFDCLGIVLQVRDDLGLVSPLMEGASIEHAIQEFRRHKEWGVWTPRRSLYFGDIGDIVLLSKHKRLQSHHCAVVVSHDRALHIYPGENVETIGLTALHLKFPGEISRWGYYARKDRGTDGAGVGGMENKHPIERPGAEATSSVLSKVIPLR